MLLGANWGNQKKKKIQKIVILKKIQTHKKISEFFSYFKD